MLQWNKLCVKTFLFISIVDTLILCVFVLLLLQILLLPLVKSPQSVVISDIHHNHHKHHTLWWFIDSLCIGVWRRLTLKDQDWHYSFFVTGHSHLVNLCTLTLSNHHKVWWFKIYTTTTTNTTHCGDLYVWKIFVSNIVCFVLLLLQNTIN